MREWVDYYYYYLYLLCANFLIVDCVERLNVKKFKCDGRRRLAEG